MPGPETSEFNWFLVHEGRRVGPFDRSSLIARLLAQDAPEAVLVWRTGLPAWTRAGKLDDLRRELPPPLPGTRPAGDGLPDVAPAEGGEAAQAAADGDGEEGPPSLPGQETAAGGEVSGEPVSEHDSEHDSGPEGATNSATRKRRRRHHPHGTSRPRVPRYVLPLALLFLAVMVGLWFLLRHMNEAPPGQILQQSLAGERPEPSDPRWRRALTGSSPAASRG